MHELRTRPELLARLRAAAGRPMTRQETRAQRVSWVMSPLPIDTDLTRGRVGQLMAALEGE